ncbi:hypothetical protein [Streptomyces bohaiensis]|uniref:DUF2530 domain-containing protein n=1 Tax=Streptomyces bohaiensis TaxID=1431344 RepID=A0ABX1CFQ2_9ACTN|nr:hypothetical protein [Streptomyces bohaiensis]NJQ17171.1 hypothetical protein [Streptomyces bohaiensis]
MDPNSYPLRNWWTELAIFLVTAAAATVAIAALWTVGGDGTVNAAVFLVPGIAIGLAVAARYRRKHMTGSRSPR